MRRNVRKNLFKCCGTRKIRNITRIVTGNDTWKRNATSHIEDGGDSNNAEKKNIVNDTASNRSNIRLQRPILPMGKVNALIMPETSDDTSPFSYYSKLSPHFY